jgi:signal transduction histidine kinase
VVESEDHIYFILKDNGIGFDKVNIINNRGFGLSGMKERAKLIDGDVEIQSSAGNGTIVEVNIPLQKQGKV